MQQEHHKIIIVGAGPGGLQLGYFLKRLNVDFVIFERGAGAGSFFETFPVHRTLISINKPNTGCDDPEKNLRWDWNSLLFDDESMLFSRYDQRFFPSADSYVTYLREFCERAELPVRFNCDVGRIRKEGQVFHLQVGSGLEATCDILVMSTGTPIAYDGSIKGSELCERYETHDRKIAACLNKEILIVGKGNAAFETAQNFVEHAARIHLVSPSPHRMAWQTHFVGDLRLINSSMLDTFFLKQQNAVFSGHIGEIKRRDEKLWVDIVFPDTKAKVKFKYDRVILCTGFRCDLGPFSPDYVPITAEATKLPSLTPRWESVNVSGLYFCGSLMQANDYKKSASAFIHGIRYNARTLSLLLSEEMGLGSYPETLLPMDVDTLLGRMFGRIRSVSSLWHMQSLCDAYILDCERGLFREIRDVPVRLMSEDPRFRESCRLELRLTFDAPRHPEAQKLFSKIGTLHPALYCFAEGKLVDESHMPEDLYAEWSDVESFGRPFRRALSRYVGALSRAA
jgi:thioredoxin reductase